MGNTETILLEAMSNCAKKYHPRDEYAWLESASYDKLSKELSAELERMGYRIEQFRFTLTESESDAVLVTNDGE